MIRRSRSKTAVATSERSWGSTLQSRWILTLVRQAPNCRTSPITTAGPTVRSQPWPACASRSADRVQLADSAEVVYVTGRLPHKIRKFKPCLVRREERTIVEYGTIVTVGFALGGCRRLEKKKEN